MNFMDKVTLRETRFNEVTIPKLTPSSSFRRIDTILIVAVIALITTVVVQQKQMADLSKAVKENTPTVIVMDKDTDITGIDMNIPPLEELK